MKHSLKRLAIGGALAGAAFAAAPALASASSTCTFDTAGHQVVIQDGSGSGQLILAKSGRYITYADDFGPPQLCVKGTTIASVTNTDSVYVQGPLVGASDGYFVDESAGTFTPGFTHEDKGASDIELDFNPTGSAVKPAFTVRGTDQADHIITGENGKIDLNGDFDADVTLDGASFASAASRVVVFGGGGNDTLDGGGYANVQPATVSESLHGGAGDDILIGGRASDELLGEAGNDDFEAYFDGYADTIVGGPGYDVSFSDKFDKADVEHNVIPLSN